jgi:hypothetical protein
MKLNFCKTIGRLRAYSLSLLSGVILTPLAGMATDSIYINTGAINNSNIPEVDATNFFNSGTWNIFGLALPYQTSHTLNYTNTGTMVSSVGWEFDYGPLPLIGERGWSASFVNNSAAATIQAIDGTVTSPHGSQNLTTASYLWVSATNIINKGMLLADPNGQIILNGSTVNLSRSQLLVDGTLASSGFVSGTNFALDAGLYPESWAQSNMPAQNLPPGISLPIMNIPNLWDGNTATAPAYAVQNNCTSNYNFGPLLSFMPTVSDSMDTKVGPTNETRQAVFVAISDPNIVAQVAWTPSSNPTNYFQTAAVQLAATLTNPFTLAPEDSSIYVVDTLGSETNRGLYVDTNVSSFYVCSGKLFQPANYTVSRSEPAAFAVGVPGLGRPPGNFFDDPTFVFTAASNSYSAYSVFVDDLASNPSGANATNLPGVIQINAKDLDLTRTWLAGQGGILIQASNLVSSAGAIVDCQNLSYYLGSTNGFLNLTNMAKQQVSRLRGTLNMWSAVWTNLQPVTVGTNQTTNNIGCSILIVDATGLSSTVPVTVQNLVMHSTNSTLSDSLTVAQTLLLDGQGVKILGQLTLSGALQDWTSVLAPNLLYFTNNGFLSVPNNAHFGDDTAVPYTEFINNGTGQYLGGAIVAGSQTIDSQDIQISNAVNYTSIGSFLAKAASIEVTGLPGYFSNSVYAAADISFYANTMQVRQSGLYANGSLNFSVTNSLSDGGAANSFICNNGFNLSVKPLTGDLLGSTLTSIASGNNAVVDSTWAGEDRGPDYTGFTDNAALGTLALVAQNYLPQFTPLFVFSPATGSNALYVMTLDLSGLTTNPSDLANMIQINPGMKIYVSQVILGFTPPGGVTPLDYVQSQFPGQIVAASATPPLITISGGSYPPGGHSFVLTWNSTSGATYSVLRTNILGNPSANWPAIITGYPTGGALGGPLSYTDTTATASPAFYRVKSP